jgi:DNA polymerase I
VTQVTGTTGWTAGNLSTMEKCLYFKHDLSKYIYIDIETDDLDASIIWCAVAKTLHNDQIYRLVGHSNIKAFIESHPNAIWVGHNALSFDIPVINRLVGTNINLDNVVDTLVLSYLYDPHMVGGHSLKAWGERLKHAKIDFHDFSCFSETMLEYCVGDVQLGSLVFSRLTDRMRAKGYSEKSAEIEHKIRVVLNEQQANGIYFDRIGSEVLKRRLRTIEQGLGERIQAVYPPTLEMEKTYPYRLTKSGDTTSHYKRHLEQYPKVELSKDGLTYSVHNFREFNIGSPAQRISKLLGSGWKPTTFTDKGNPKADEDSVVAFAKESGIEAVGLIAEWMVVNARGNMIQGWQDTVQADSRIHGRVMTCGAATRRMTHNSPNTANIPKAKESVKYGKECRALWQATPGRVLVGYDAAGLEMRCFSHYLGDPAIAKLYLEGDPHQVNADLLGIDRDTVKNVFYAFLYGAGDPKLGSTAKQLGSKKQLSVWGADARSKLVSGTTGLGRLIETINKEWATGFIQTIDGGYVRSPGTPTAALNYKLQSAGGIVMKQASIFIRERIIAGGYDSFKVLDVHDEAQFDTDPRCASEVGQLCVQALRDAGEELGFSVPLDGEFKIGRTWADTH